MNTRYDVAVIGSGFAGSILAMIARRLGLSVLLLERGQHPRVVIGESSTPLSNLLLEELADRYDLPNLKPLTKWGAWQKAYPHLACGLKRGFSFFHHTLDAPGETTSGGKDRLLVAASPNDTIADTHWYRADTDTWLVEQAQELGVDYFDALELGAPIRKPDGWTLYARRGDQPLTWHARLLLDATGPRGFLHRAFDLGQLPLGDYPHTSALYSHFTGVREFADVRKTSSAEAPYPVDAAALHHVFDGGWIWMLRFNNGVTSVGVAASKRIADRFHFAEREHAWTRLLKALPMIQEQCAEARTLMPFSYLPELGFRSAVIAGESWALLPSAAGFVDPLLSTGFSLSLLGVLRLAELLERDFATTRLGASLQLYAKQTEEDLLATARLIAGLYRCMNDFPTFRAISLLYFAAVSYDESARRLGTPEFAGSFLLHDHPVFGPESRRLLARVSSRLSTEECRILREDIYRLIEPFDVAGLSRRPADHSYPVRADDLLTSAHKLGVSRQQIATMLERSGFYGGSDSR